LVGRNFVPTGKLAAPAFNFIFRACRECNARKADAERHVSSVTLLNSPRRRTDPAVEILARRKGQKDFSPRVAATPIGEDLPRHQVEFPMMGATWRFDMTAPPQLDSDLATLLAFNQVQALFSMITTMRPQVPSSTRLLPFGDCHQLGIFPRQDWGNPRLREVQKRTRSWEQRAIVVTAEDYFKALLRRGTDEEGWFWALEWNHSVRVAGCIARAQEMPAVLRDLPDLGWSTTSDGLSRFRQEIPLREEDDTLFLFDEDPPADAAPNDA
jgi:hypothetical protein